MRRYSSPLIGSLASFLLLPAMVSQGHAASDFERGAAVAGGIVALDTLTNTLSPKERERIHQLPTEEAWNVLLTPSRARAIPSLVGTVLNRGQLTNDDREAQKKAILERIEKAFAEHPLPLDAYDAMCKALAASLSEALFEETGASEPRGGGRFALTVGAFRLIPRAGAKADPKLSGLLQNVIDHLSSSRELRQKFSIIAYNDAEDVQQVIKRIGGDSEDWLNPDGSNVAEVAGRRFHPDNIYVLTGGFIEQREGDYSLQYEVTGRVAHPRSGGANSIATQKVRTKYLMHPTRYWLTEEQDNALRTASRARR